MVKLPPPWPARWDGEKGNDPEFTSWRSAIDQQEQKTTLTSTRVSVTTSLWQRLYWHFLKKCAVSMFGSFGATRQTEQVTETKTLIQREKKKPATKREKNISGGKRWKHRVQRGKIYSGLSWWHDHARTSSSIMWPRVLLLPLWPVTARHYLQITQHSAQVLNRLLRCKWRQNALSGGLLRAQWLVVFHFLCREPA